MGSLVKGQATLVAGVPYLMSHHSNFHLKWLSTQYSKCTKWGVGISGQTFLTSITSCLLISASGHLVPRAIVTTSRNEQRVFFFLSQGGRTTGGKTRQQRAKLTTDNPSLGARTNTPENHPDITVRVLLPGDPPGARPGATVTPSPGHYRPFHPRREV